MITDKYNIYGVLDLYWSRLETLDKSTVGLDAATEMLISLDKDLNINNHDTVSPEDLPSDRDLLSIIFYLSIDIQDEELSFRIYELGIHLKKLIFQPIVSESTKEEKEVVESNTSIKYIFVIIVVIIILSYFFIRGILNV